MGLALSGPGLRPLHSARLRLIRLSSGGCRAVCRMPEVPADNPMTTVKVALGRRLFYDTRFSGNGTFACASCHQQAHAFTDGRPRAIGSTGQSHARSAMSLTNVAYNSSFGWADPGRADARGADVGADVQRASDRAWDCRARSGDRAPVRRRATTRRGSLRRSRPIRSPCRWRTSSGPSRRSSGRCSRLIRRSIDISIATIGPPSHSRRFAA